MKYFRTALVFLFLFPACGRKEAIPKGVLPTAKMEALMLDLARADQYAAGLRASDTNYHRTIEAIRFYKEVMELHGVDKATLEKSLDYYKTRPAVMKAILDTVYNRQERLMSNPFHYTPDTSQQRTDTFRNHLQVE